jgi:hypothetical protein
MYPLLLAVIFFGLVNLPSRLVYGFRSSVLTFEQLLRYSLLTKQALLSYHNVGVRLPHPRLAGWFWGANFSLAHLNCPPPPRLLRRKFVSQPLGFIRPVRPSFPTPPPSLLRLAPPLQRCELQSRRHESAGWRRRWPATKRGSSLRGCEFLLCCPSFVFLVRDSSDIFQYPTYSDNTLSSLCEVGACWCERWEMHWPYWIPL